MNHHTASKAAIIREMDAEELEQLIAQERDQLTSKELALINNQYQQLTGKLLINEKAEDTHHA
jgi:hypothetical protein